MGMTVASLGAAAAPNTPPIVVFVAEGTGYPFEDPQFSKSPSLRRLRQGSRPFDATFANDAAWSRTAEMLLGGVRKGNAALVAAVRARGYQASAITAKAALRPPTVSQTGNPARSGFSRSSPLMAISPLSPWMIWS